MLSRRTTENVSSEFSDAIGNVKHNSNIFRTYPRSIVMVTGSVLMEAALAIFSARNRKGITAPTPCIHQGTLICLTAFIHF